MIYTIMNSRDWKLSFSSLLILTSFLIGCVDIEGPVREPAGPKDILSRVDVGVSSVYMESGTTFKLDFAAISMSGDTIPINEDSIQWSSADGSTVSIRNDGLITGLKESDGGVRLISKLTYRYVTRSDTIQVFVTDEKIDADRLKLVYLDSGRSDMNPFYGRNRVRVDLYRGDSVIVQGSTLPVEIEKPSTLTLNPTGGISKEPVYTISTGSQIGKFWIKSSVNLYGITLKDSLEYTGLHMGYGTGLTLRQADSNSFNTPTNLDTIPLRIYQPCTFVVLGNVSNDSIDIVFSDSTAPSTDCEVKPIHGMVSLAASFPFIYGVPAIFTAPGIIGGNVVGLPPNTFISRQSRTVGVISYRIRNSRTKQYYPYLTSHLKQVAQD